MTKTVRTVILLKPEQVRKAKLISYLFNLRGVSEAIRILIDAYELPENPTARTDDKAEDK